MSAPRVTRVLVANRGEIAVRIFRACRELAISSVAVYSDLDRRSPHVRAADRAHALGGESAADTYLSIDKIVDAARKTGADAIHPGYGFLSERAAFARAVEDAGLVFIGPSSKAIEAMGDKLSARRAMIAAGVPVVPGTEAPVRATDPDLPQVARAIGYPVLVKAAAGGGGKGMRVVRSEAELVAAVRQAGNEAQAAFGDGSVFLERYIARPRHVEIQLLGDLHGNLVYLGERECSIQRRHQKLVEEAPSTAVSPELRRRLGEAAVAAGRSVGYASAGTAEFLLDEDGSFYFLEMNTRLQVEHPVTEMVTGLDLVHAQLRVAQGQPSGLVQRDVTIRGHAIECRICAEDPYNGFVPAPGLIEGLATPAGPWVRLDSGIDAGTRVTSHYDPLVAKLIAWGATRADAIARMDRALAELTIVGIPTTIPFHRWVMANPAFRAGRTSIRFIEEEMKDGLPRPDAGRARLLACALHHAGAPAAPPVANADTPSRWTLEHRSRWRQ